MDPMTSATRTPNPEDPEIPAGIRRKHGPIHHRNRHIMARTLDTLAAPPNADIGNAGFSRGKGRLTGLLISHTFSQTYSRQGTNNDNGERP